MQLIKQRAAAGEPLIFPSSDGTRPIQPSDSKPLSLVSFPTTKKTETATDPDAIKVPEKQRMEKLKRFGLRGMDLLETSRQIAAGDRQVKLSFAPTGVGMDASVGLLVGQRAVDTLIPHSSHQTQSLSCSLALASRDQDSS